jgi:hypothetical protein
VGRGRPQYNVMRSSFEEQVSETLDRLGVRYEYETHTMEYFKPIRKAVCNDCKGRDVAKLHIYNPDFWLPDHGFYIEAKGQFGQVDRMKMRLVKQYHPDEDIRMVFMRDNYIGKKSVTRTRYIEYAEKYGMKAGLLSDMEGWLT